MKKSLLLLAVAGTALGTQAQLVVDNTTLTAEQLIQDVLLGAGVIATNITLNGGPANMTFEQTGTFNGVNSNIGIDQGIMLGSGDINVAPGPNVGGGSTLGGGNFGITDTDLELLSGVNMNDRCVIEFDFIPIGDSIAFKYVFSSEEYNEYVCATVNDAFGFFLSGPGISGPYSNNSINLALIPGTQTPVTINTVNNGTVGGNGQLINCENLDPNWENNNIYYSDNTGGLTVEYDGSTVVLTARAAVQCGQVHHIKLAIADGGDTAFDSGVFLEGGSFTSAPFVPDLQPGPGIVGLNTILESCFEVEFLFTRVGDSTFAATVDIEIGGTATPGVDYLPPFPSQLNFAPFQTEISFTLNAPIDADGPETIIVTMISESPCTVDSLVIPFNFIIDAPDPLIAIGGAFLLDCGESVQLTPTITGGYGAVEYQWSVGGDDPSILYTPTQVQDVTVLVTDTCGATSTGFFAVELTPPPPITAVLTGPDPLVEGCDQANLTVTRPAGTTGDLLISLAHTGIATPGGDYSINEPVIISGGSNNEVVSLTPIEDNQEEGTEGVTITASYSNACNQAVVATVNTTIVDSPPLEIVTEPLLIIPCGDDSIPVIAEVSGGIAPLNVVWTDGTEGSVTYASNSVDSQVTLNVTDDCGHTASASVTIDPQCAIIIPNVFSPNNDGSNDTFFIDGIIASKSTVRIYNRWGNLVYEATNYKNNWKAEGLPDGTYYYEVKVDRDPEPYTGHVTILSSGRRQ